MVNQSLSLSLAGLTAREGSAGAVDPRAAIQWAAGLGYRAIQLDGAAAGVRPRELDRSGRRDLAALLRRLQLGLSGIDLWIPPAHFTDLAQADRAASATIQALELAADLSRLVGSGNGAVVSMVFPDKPAIAVLDSLASAADRVGARIADHQWPARAGVGGPLGIGVDPAALLAAGADPASEVSRLAAVPASARLSDSAPGGRVGIGAGRLDVLAYCVALATKGYARPLVVDLRGVPNQDQGAKDAMAAAGAA